PPDYRHRLPSAGKGGQGPARRSSRRQSRTDLGPCAERRTAQHVLSDSAAWLVVPGRGAVPEPHLYPLRSDSDQGAGAGPGPLAMPPAAGRRKASATASLPSTLEIAHVLR